jgi:hypothetical protein
MAIPQPAIHVTCPACHLTAADDRSPNLDELDDLMEKALARAPPIGDNAKATLATALALIDDRLAALEAAVCLGHRDLDDVRLFDARVR